jgi:hypothetical protein
MKRPNIKRLRSALVVVTALVSATFLVQSAAGTGVAWARCAGAGHEVVSNLVLNGELLINERPNSGTCNGNNLYGATFRNETGDPSWRATVWIQNNGVWTPHSGGFDTAAHSYSYSDNNSSSLMSLCLDDGVVALSGWGANVIENDNDTCIVDFATGTNTGF